MKPAQSQLRYWTRRLGAAALVVAAFLAITEVNHSGQSWGELPGVALAIVLQIVSVIVPLVGGLFTLARVSDRTRRPWLGAIAGILVAVLLLIALGYAVRSVPGVGWRIDAMAS